MREIVFDLVKFYFKSQANNVEAEVTEILKQALTSGSVAALRAISGLMVALHQEDGVEGSSREKFMTLCHALKVVDLVKVQADIEKSDFMQVLFEKAKLATWLNAKP